MTIKELLTFYREDERVNQSNLFEGRQEIKETLYDMLLAKKAGKCKFDNERQKYPGYFVNPNKVFRKVIGLRSN